MTGVIDDEGEVAPVPPVAPVPDDVMSCVFGEGTPWANGDGGSGGGDVVTGIIGEDDRQALLLSFNGACDGNDDNAVSDGCDCDDCDCNGGDTGVAIVDNVVVVVVVVEGVEGVIGVGTTRDSFNDFLFFFSFLSFLSFLSFFSLECL